ncbi:hypothetical protein OF829_15600 [Sphingomonas sp. LB-2]|uniref:hypothetical protein n=1 Tax=Sphingomonas caeni TaxID=2984949 RepID=UPI002231F895|nr:hypothetical protein [Sphingomonas caeni]MCW3848660.1 hypothetical protein [Sphingomonas caeni]
MTTVNFHMTTPDGTDATVELRNSQIHARIRLTFDENGDATTDAVDPTADYTVAWELTGTINDKIVVDWRADGQSGRAATGSITVGNSIPVPGDRRRTEGRGYLPVIGG